VDIVTYALLKKYVKASLAGAGAIEGKDGASAYEIAVKNGFSGSESEWIASLAGTPG
jgi:integrin beta 8